MSAHGNPRPTRETSPQQTTTGPQRTGPQRTGPQTTRPSEKPRRRRRRVLIGIAGVAAVALLALALLGASRVRGLWSSDAVPTYTVEKRAFVRRIATEGNLRAVKATPLVPNGRARVPLKIMWLADDGSHVEEGDVVVRFDPSDWQKKLQDGQAAHVTAERKIAKERITVGTAVENRDRDSQLAARELEQTQRFQPKNEVIFSRNQIIESEFDEQYSRAKMEHAHAARDIESSLSQSKLSLLEIEKRTAGLQIKQAEEGLESLVLTAPHAGIMVLKRDWFGNTSRVGDQVWPGQAVAELPLTDSMEAEVFVLEADAGGLQEGLPAELIIEAHPETPYQAKIKRVDKLAKPRLSGVPVQYFGVVLELENTDPALMKPGQRVQATLILDEHEALVVPRPAVFEKDGKPVVYKQLDNGDFQPVDVVIGVSSPGLVVIEEGLSDGDRIALRNPTRPRDGDGDGDNDNSDGDDNDNKGGSSGKSSAAARGGR